jgi:chitinase
VSASLPPGPIIVGYSQEGACNEQNIDAAVSGVNVIIWFSINMISRNGSPVIIGGPNYDCVASVIKTIRDLNLTTTHLMSIGGWGSPHISTSFTAAEWWKTWLDWNKNIVARPDMGFNGFEGLDWDLEGNNDINNSDNFFTTEVLNLMGEISQLAKQAGYIVSMAPPQSYLDDGTNDFDQSVLHNPSWEANFPYQGWNTYAPILVKYGTTQITSPQDGSLLATVPTFDFISIQLYEGWSRSNYLINNQKMPVATYLTGLVNQMVRGWQVDFSKDTAIGIKTQNVSVSLDQLVIGLANAWAGPRPAKCLLVYPAEAQTAWEALKSQGKTPRGFMFWDIQDEGKLVNGTPFYLAKGLNSFMKIR